MERTAQRAVLEVAVALNHRGHRTGRGSAWRLAQLARISKQSTTAPFRPESVASTSTWLEPRKPPRRAPRVLQTWDERRKCRPFAD